MSKVLVIEASPRAHSYSTQVTETFIESYKAAHPNDTVEILSVWSPSIPEFNLEAVNGKYMLFDSSKPLPQAWENVVKTINHFKSFDKYVIASPMWNFSIPHKLKNYIDVIIQPGLTFGVDPDKGIIGLVQNKKLMLILARGGKYQGSPVDFQEPYLRTAFGMIGFKDIQTIFIEGTSTPEKQNAVENSKIKAIELARTF